MEPRDAELAPSRRLCANSAVEQAPRSRFVGALALLLASSLGACEQRAQPPARVPSAPTDAEREQVVARATAAIDPLKKKLSEALTAAMTTGGPVAAIDVCSQQAPQMAAEASTPELSVGRSALKLRNPNNRARDWLAPILGELAALPSAEGAERVVKLDGSRFGYAQAITLKPPCVTCHGTDIAPPVAERLAQRYPQDQAIGFQPGQLRGVFWAELSMK